MRIFTRPLKNAFCKCCGIKHTNETPVPHFYSPHNEGDSWYCEKCFDKMFVKTGIIKFEDYSLKTGGDYGPHDTMSPGQENAIRALEDAGWDGIS